MSQRPELSDNEIQVCIHLVKVKINVRLREKHRGAYAGNHETYGILAEEFNKELLDALHAKNNEKFFDELIDIAVGAILGMASMEANGRKAGE